MLMMSSLSEGTAPLAAKSACVEPRVDQAAVQLGLRVGQRPADQLQPAVRVVLVKFLVELVGRRAGVDQPCGQPQRAGRGRTEAEPAGVGGQGHEGRAGDLAAVSGTPNGSAASTTSRPVASASAFLNSSAPKSSPLT